MSTIILAGILGIPCLLVAAITAPIVGLLAIPSLLLLLFQKAEPHADDSAAATPDHVIIVGGSSGIGLAVAKVSASQKKVPKITILARDQTKLDQAKREIDECAKAASSATQVQAISVCVTDYEGLRKVAARICAGNDKTKGSTAPQRTVLFNCAGIPYTAEFESVPVEEYGRLVETNQLGAMYVVRAFLPYLHQGCIVLCSSVAGQVGPYGYAAYSPTKFALRGLAEALHAELLRTKPGVSVQVAFPADTATPGYETERKTMPEITKILNANAGLARPEDTAKVMVDSAFAKNPIFQVYFTLEGWMLSNLTAGMTPVSNLFDALTQVALGGTFRFISLFYLNDFWRIIRTYQPPPATATKKVATSDKNR